MTDMAHDKKKKHSVQSLLVVSGMGSRSWTGMPTIARIDLPLIYWTLDDIIQSVKQSQSYTSK